MAGPLARWALVAALETALARQVEPGDVGLAGLPPAQTLLVALELGALLRRE